MLFSGVGAMELVAMDMKLRGMYIARQLSFKGVSFRIEEIPIAKDYVNIYNESVKLVSTKCNELPGTSPQSTFISFVVCLLLLMASNIAGLTLILFILLVTVGRCPR